MAPLAAPKILDNLVQQTVTPETLTATPPKKNHLRVWLSGGLWNGCGRAACLRCNSLNSTLRTAPMGPRLYGY